MAAPSPSNPGIVDITSALRERELIHAVQSGDAKALDTIFGLYAEGMFRFTLRYVQQREIAEEIVQDVFLSVWVSRSSWTVRGSLRAYLLTVARGKAIDWVRRERAGRRAIEKSILDDSDAAPQLRNTATFDDDTQAEIARAIAQLPARAREAYILRWEQQLSYAEVAQVMGTSVKTVENQLARGLKILKEKLKHLI